MTPALPPPPLDYEARMSRQEEVVDLRVIGQDVFGREVRLMPAAAEAWKAMLGTSKSEGVRLLLLSGFRSVQRQSEIVRKKIEAGIPLPDILTVSAYPGYSEHHTGRAIDLGAPGFEHLDEAFERSPEFTWLRLYAGNFGFGLSYPRSNPHGIAYEPWHWCLKQPSVAMPET